MNEAGIPWWLWRESMQEKDEIQAVQCWLKNTVIKHNFCPFAQREFDRGSIRYSLIESVDVMSQLEALMLECRYLDEHAETETSLLIYPHGLSIFDDFLDFVALANDLLLDQGYEGIYQLANFHPDYCFADEDEDDPANYTNRSPRPMLHLIREHSLEKAVANYPNPESIPERNIALARSLGMTVLREALEKCQKG